MSFKSTENRVNKTYSAIKWQLTALSGVLTTSLIIMLES